MSRLRGCGVFRNFGWPTDLPEFGRHNLIYGWNGTGKTTLSRLFRDLAAILHERAEGARKKGFFGATWA